MGLLVIEPIIMVALEIAKEIAKVHMAEFEGASPEQKQRWFELRLRSLERADRILERLNGVLFPKE